MQRGLRFRVDAPAAAIDRLTNYIPSPVETKAWCVESLPACDDVRPTHCPKCNVASSPPGKPKRLHGHGVRERQQQGPIVPGAVPTIWTVITRRYKCTQCGSVCSTGPRSVAQRYLYSAPAIVYACALRAFDKLSVGAVRKRVGVGARQGDNNHGRWSTPGRWMADIANGRLLQGLDLKTTVTKLAASFCERISQCVIARAPPELSPLPPAVRAFFTPQRVWFGPGS